VIAIQAILSDVHGNLEALTAVLSHIRAKGIEEIICLGDLVGYGPRPAECLDLAYGFAVNVRGNHEEAVLKGAFGFNPTAREAIDWTRGQLKPRWTSTKQKKDRWEFLRHFPLKHENDSVLFVHGSPRDPTMEYILKSDCEDFFGEPPKKLQDIFGRIRQICFVGHTHCPGIITEDYEFLTPPEIGYRFRVEPGRKLVVNVGSVGQPRDGDPRASYLTFDGEEIRYDRVEYDVDKTVRQIEEIPELNDRNGLRLRYGA
jgi:diadenosine tetraphosphatase ApaH/serine/threonine PP2A family protein phosphatase